jgi:hypothetical protein
MKGFSKVINVLTINLPYDIFKKIAYGRLK